MAGETGLTKCLVNLGLVDCRTGLTQPLDSLAIGELMKDSITPMEEGEGGGNEREINTMELVEVLDELLTEGGGLRREPGDCGGGGQRRGN